MNYMPNYYYDTDMGNHHIPDEERALVLVIFITSVAKLYGSVLGAVDGDTVNEITARRSSLGLTA